MDQGNPDAVLAAALLSAALVVVLLGVAGGLVRYARGSSKTEPDTRNLVSYALDNDDHSNDGSDDGEHGMDGGPLCQDDT